MFPVRNLTRADVKVWFADLNPQTPRVRAKAYALLRSIMNGAVDDELISVNPVHIRGAGAAREEDRAGHAGGARGTDRRDA